MESTITRSIYHLGGKATSLQIYSNIGNKSGDQKFINIHDHLDIMVADGRLRCELVPANNGDSSYRRVYSVTGPN